MNGKIGAIELLNIKIKKDGEVIYEGLGADVPEEYKVEYKKVKTNIKGIVYEI